MPPPLYATMCVHTVWCVRLYGVAHAVRVLIAAWNSGAVLILGAAGLNPKMARPMRVVDIAAPPVNSFDQNGSTWYVRQRQLHC